MRHYKKVFNYNKRKKMLEKIAKLKAQQNKLDRAEISTIHSFCYSLIKKNFTVLSLPARMRIV